LYTVENALKSIKWCWNLSILWKRDFSRSYDEHDEILIVYRKRDRATYETLVRRHIHDALERFRKEYVRRRQVGEKATPQK
jgi:DNA-binding GntR family transcriptional regulator